MRANPDIAVLAAQINHAAGVPLNREQRRAARRSRPVAHRRPIDSVAGLRLLDHSRPYEPMEMLEEHVKTRAAFERLRTGCGDEEDFDRVSMILNVGLIRAEQIDASLVQAIQAGQMAFVRMKDRFLRGLGFGFDAQGLRDSPDALDTYEAIMDASSPMQMTLAIQSAYRRITAGELLEIPA